MEEQNGNANVEAPTSLVKIVGNPTPGALLQVALERGTSVDQLEKLMELQMRWEANEARKAYVAAMARFKASPPRIVKDKKVVAGQAKYTHASIARIVQETAGALGQHGLSSAWETKQDKDAITVTCMITHELGHRESVTLSGPPDKSGSKNPIQMIGSTVTYLQRYTLLAVLGLATEEQDDADRPGAPSWANGRQEKGKDSDDPSEQKADLPERTRKAIAAFRSLDVRRDDLEHLAGNFDEVIFAEAWTEEHFARFTEARAAILAVPVAERAAKVREIFHLDAGALG